MKNQFWAYVVAWFASANLDQDTALCLSWSRLQIQDEDSFSRESSGTCGHSLKIYDCPQNPGWLVVLIITSPCFCPARGWQWCETLHTGGKNLVAFVWFSHLCLLIPRQSQGTISWRCHASLWQVLLQNTVGEKTSLFLTVCPHAELSMKSLACRLGPA